MTELESLRAKVRALEAQLAAKDAEIIAWLRKQSSTGVFFADAIASGAYRKDEAND